MATKRLNLLCGDGSQGGTVDVPANSQEVTWQFPVSFTSFGIGVTSYRGGTSLFGTVNSPVNSLTEGKVKSNSAQSFLQTFNVLFMGK